MSYQCHMRGYEDPRTLYQIDGLHAWTHGQYFPPVMVEISPTHRCNQRCRYCYADKGGEQGEMLRDDILVDAFAQVAEAGVKSVLVQGTGEPLIHKALPQAIALGAQKGLSIGLVTNGVLLTPALQEQIAGHLFFIRFSVLESDPQRYAYLHGCPAGQWHSLIANLKNLVDLRRRHNLSSALWATIYLYPDNIGHLYEIVKFFKEIGLDYVVVQEASYTEFSPCGKEKYASDSLAKSRIDDLKAGVMTLADDDFKVKMRFPINDETYFVGKNRECWENDFCQGVRFYTILSSDGHVYPCWRFWGKKQFSYGSMYEKRFDRIWRDLRRQDVIAHLNRTPPDDDACAVCNITKLNEILYKLRNATGWRDFLM